MFERFRFNPPKKKLISIVYTFIFVLVILLNANKSNLAVHFRPVRIKPVTYNNRLLQIHHQLIIQRPGLSIKIQPEDLALFQPSDSGGNFDSRVRDFFRRNQCRLQIFMTWISAVESFSDREFVGLETLFQTNPTACLVILSKTMDSRQGYEVLKPLIKRGLSVEAMSPDLTGLVNGTSAECWLSEIEAGIRDPGEIPLAQNLSNLIRLLALYKYGGVYLDTDVIILRDISTLKNSIGAQSVDTNGTWTRLNNAVLIFDKKHPLLHRFIKEFAMTFDGNIWGHNGPYLVSRVVNRTLLQSKGIIDFTILPPMAFYPVDWKRIEGYFTRPTDHGGKKWVDAKMRQLRGVSYGVHLWNRESRRMRIEEGSIVGRLLSEHCVICSINVTSVS